MLWRIQVFSDFLQILLMCLLGVQKRINGNYLLFIQDYIRFSFLLIKMKHMACLHVYT